jgi:hypothetical protein
MRARLVLVLVLAIVSVGVLGLSACGGDDGTTTTSASPPPTTTPPPPQPPPPPPAPPTPAPKPEVTTVRIVVRGGEVRGGIQRATVDQGKKVAIVVSSDVADEVHLHGYDKMVDVAPGKPARLAFVASIPGRFEVELENRGLQIADIEVRP